VSAADLLGAMLEGVTVEVTTSLTPPVAVDLSDAVSGEPSALVKFLKPRVRVYSRGALLKEVAPHGDPTPPNYWLVGALVWGGALAFILWRARK
jgi:hypothetical protein